MDNIGYHKSLRLSNYAAKKHKDLEHKVLNSADTIIVTSNTTKTEFQAITTKPIAVITNGYDVENVVKQALDTKFSFGTYWFSSFREKSENTLGNFG